MGSGFPIRFADALGQAGAALDSKGYNVTGYGAAVSARDEYLHKASTPSQALVGTLDDMTGEELEIPIQGRDFAKLVRDGEPPISVVYDCVWGAVDVEDPIVEIESTGAEYRAFGTNIIYIPDFPNDYFEIGTTDTMGSYTVEDAEERVNDIVNILEESDLTAEISFIN